MKNKFSIFILCVLFLGCTENKKQVELTKTVQILVDSLSISDKSTPNLVFISDNYPKARNYKSYHKFIKIATEKELISLTQHKKPNIRCYAFNGLVERNFSGLRKIFEEHIKDTAKVHLSYGGCVVSKITVMEFMLDQLHPFGSKSLEKFSRQEYEKYRKLTMEFRKNKASH